VLVGLLACIPALRLRGFYLAIVTLALPIILVGIIFRFKDFTGGDIGLSGIDRIASSKLSVYYITTIIMLISVYIMYKITDIGSKIVRIGVIFHAIREDEISARTSGINTTRYKMLAFAVSAFFAGVAGALYTLYIRIAAPQSLALLLSFQAILWTIFGGIRTIYGPVAGVYLLYPMIALLRLHPIGTHIRFVLFGLILIVTLLFMPEGLTTWIRDKIEIECPRCKLSNAFTRHNCRACRAPMHMNAK